MYVFKEAHLVSRIDQKIAQLDPKITSRKTLHQLLYARSSLSQAEKREQPKPNLWARFLEHRDRFLQTIENSIYSHFSQKAERPFFPVLMHAFTSAPIFLKNFQPALYIFRGVDEHKIPAPIPFLIEEPEEEFDHFVASEMKKLIEEQLKKKGKLTENSKGFIYVEVQDEFIRDLLPLINDPNAKPAPYLDNYTSPSSPHIPVILVSERQAKEIANVKEVGEEVAFEILGLHSVSPHNWPKVDKVWFLTVLSSRLEEIRRRYRLPPRIGGHDFIIAIAVLYSGKKKKKPAKMRINPAFIAA
ncbi:MAG TPA: hypothetical protein VLG44_01065 [Chlamydiales bacterium]|nr:hypothetical protein [Chlamydiales bacterium]